MPRFAANITFLFTEVPFLDRFEAAARAGFRGVEFHYPYAFDPDEIRRRLDAHALTPVLMNIHAGNHALGEWGFAGIPGDEDRFRQCVSEAIAYARQIGIKQVNCLAGVKPAQADVHTCELTLIDNVRHAADACARAGLVLNLEALNTRDVPGFLISNSSDATRLIDAIGAGNVMLQYDWYHMQIMEGGDANHVENVLADTMRRLLPVIGHIQFADAPGRHQPGTGRIDFPTLFAQVDAIGYTGWVSAEYRPSGRTEDSLGWMAPMLPR
jgi:hydroxypyruvate isomerase